MSNVSEPIIKKKKYTFYYEISDREVRFIILPSLHMLRKSWRSNHQVQSLQ